MDNHEEKGAANPVGRPPAYRPEYVQEILDYFNPANNVRADGKQTLPLLSGFAWKIGVTRETLHDWATSGKYPEFSYAHGLCKAAQDCILITGGLSGDFNATFASLTAKNILSWRDKQDTALTGADGGAIQHHHEIVRTVHYPQKAG